VRQVLRRVEPWSVLRFSVLFYASFFVVLVVAGLLLWIVASITGVVSDIEDFIKELFALDTFSFKALTMLVASLLGGLVLVLVGTGLNLLMAVLYNLIADVIGGVEVTVVEEDSGPRAVV
jgi:hypothetical protein